jgi:hypothetical protein
VLDLSNHYSTPRYNHNRLCRLAATALQSLVQRPSRENPLQELRIAHCLPADISDEETNSVINQLSLAIGGTATLLHKKQQEELDRKYEVEKVKKEEEFRLAEIARLQALSKDKKARAQAGAAPQKLIVPPKPIVKVINPNSTLKVLDISYCSLTEVAIVELCDAISVSQITELNLSGNMIKTLPSFGAVGDMLRLNRALQVLNLSHCGIPGGARAPNSRRRYSFGEHLGAVLGTWFVNINCR